jgi:choline dehydrogenase-like flavoprotein
MLTRSSTLTMDTYDHGNVIVGAGSAGCVLAARFWEDPNHRVLLLETGGPLHGDAGPLVPASAHGNPTSLAFAVAPKGPGRSAGGTRDLKQKAVDRSCRHRTPRAIPPNGKDAPCEDHPSPRALGVRAGRLGLGEERVAELGADHAASSVLDGS